MGDFNNHVEKLVQGLLFVCPSYVQQWEQLDYGYYELFTISDGSTTLYALHLLTQAKNVIVAERVFPLNMLFFFLVICDVHSMV